MNDKMKHPLLRWSGPDAGIVQARGHAVEICGAETGHTVRAVAYCDDERRATDIVTACNSHAVLVEALEWIVEDGCSDSRAVECARAALKSAS